MVRLLKVVTATGSEYFISMAQDWQVPADAICPDELRCMYCGKLCETTEVIYTGDDESYAGFEVWCFCEDCQTDTFYKMVKDETYLRNLEKILNSERLQSDSGSM